MSNIVFSPVQKRQHKGFEPDKKYSSEDGSRKIQKALPQHNKRAVIYIS